MFKRVLCLLLAGFLLSVVGMRPAYAGSKEEKETRLAEKVRKGISKLGTGPAAHVEVTLRDKTKLKDDQNSRQTHQAISNQFNQPMRPVRPRRRSMAIGRTPPARSPAIFTLVNLFTARVVS